MGQQVYEHEIREALLRLGAAGWQFRDIRVSSLRGKLRGARRSPTRLLERAPFPVAQALGLFTYRTCGLVHRLDLRLPPNPGPEVITIHDLPLFHYADEGRLPRSAAAGAQRARLIICPSEFAAQEIREFLGASRVRVIPYGLSSTFANPVPAHDETLASLGIRGPFVLHAAGATTRKNLGELARAWRELAIRYPDLQLLLCGPPDLRRTEAFRNQQRIVAPGRLSPSMVSSLMARASAVVVPSLYEGFGLPALEGMACGVPVVASYAGALPEVCGDAALLVDPTAYGIATGISRVLEDAELGRELRARGRDRVACFSWDAAARAHLDAYGMALAD
jgi:glycosyltransferase involved in cell wall biosynthesis